MASNDTMGETEGKQIYELLETWVEMYMSGDRFDASHDFQHVQRVVSNARHILQVEASRPGARAYDAHVVDLAALLHDVDDRKYNRDVRSSGNTVKMALVNAGADEALAHRVQLICANVSYSNEIKHPAEVRAVLARHPELAVVQDADRLDALGAVGIARTFAYTGALTAKGDDRSLAETIQHFHDKLEKLEDMMKTEEGTRLARERTTRLKQFRDWFAEENSAKSAALDMAYGKTAYQTGQ